MCINLMARRVMVLLTRSLLCKARCPIELGMLCMVPIAETHRFLDEVKLSVSRDILPGPWQPTANLPSR